MRHPILAAVLIAIPLGSALPAQTPPPPHHLVEVSVKDTRHLLRLLRLDLDLASCRAPEAGADKKVEVIASDADIQTLSDNGFPFVTKIRNLEDHYEAEMRRNSLGQPETLTPPLGQGAMGGHYTLAQVEAILDSFATKYPKLCTKKVSIGKSIENRDIWMVKISDNVTVDENEPEVFYDALHHAREPLSMEATLLFMDELLDGYGTDPEATFIIDERELYFVPVVNPDGYEYNRSTRPNGGGTWRGNRRRNSGGSYGVDLNRNYTTGWSAPNGGNSTTEGSSTYRGTAPFSEPETAAIQKFVQTRKFVQVNSCHTYTEVLLSPWGYQNGTPTNGANYSRLIKRLLAKNAMANGPASTALYIAAGTALDYHHAVTGAYSWTPELGTSSEGGFWPSGQTIITIARRHQPMFRAIALTSGPLLGFDSVTVTEVGGNNNGVVEPGESGAIVIKANNDGAGSTLVPAGATLTAKTSGINLGTATASFGTIPGFGSATNTTAPLTFSIPANFTGLIVKLEVALTGDGVGTKRDITIALAPLRTAVADDMEKDRGFTRATVGTATTGLWDRGAPQQTSNGSTIYQPGTQHTPGGQSCWATDTRAGSSVGTYDVDGGYTDLLSPVLDLSHMALAEVEFYRWYAESTNDDPFQVFVSSNGGVTWTEVFSSAANTNAWVKYSYELPGPLTSQMQFRMRAQDLNASLVEAAVDDFAITGITDDGSVTVLTSGARSTTLQVGLNGSSGGNSTLLLGLVKVAPIPIPGITGALQLDPNQTFILPSVSFGAGGFTPVDVPIPNDPALVNKTVYWQALYTKGTTARFGNVQSTTVK